MVLFGIVMGLFYGWLCGARPGLRYRLVVSVALTISATWAFVLLWPGSAPTWLLVLLVAVLGGAGPASMIAFDFSRAYNPIQRLGSANGIVNIGGFLATLVTMYLIGVSLDLIHGYRLNAATAGEGASTVGLYDLDAFRIAMWIQVAVILVGLLGLRREHRLLKNLRPNEPVVELRAGE